MGAAPAGRATLAGGGLIEAAAESSVGTFSVALGEEAVLPPSSRATLVTVREMSSTPVSGGKSGAGKSSMTSGAVGSSTSARALGREQELNMREIRRTRLASSPLLIATSSTQALAEQASAKTNRTQPKDTRRAPTRVMASFAVAWQRTTAVHSFQVAVAPLSSTAVKTAMS